MKWIRRATGSLLGEAQREAQFHWQTGWSGSDEWMMKRGRECLGVEDQDKVLYMSPGWLEWIERKGAWWTGSTGRIFYVRGCCIVIFFFTGAWAESFSGPVQWPVQGSWTTPTEGEPALAGSVALSPRCVIISSAWSKSVPRRTSRCAGKVVGVVWLHWPDCRSCAGRPHQQR